MIPSPAVGAVAFPPLPALGKIFKPRTVLAHSFGTGVSGRTYQKSRAIRRVTSRPTAAGQARATGLTRYEGNSRTASATAITKVEASGPATTQAIAVTELKYFQFVEYRDLDNLPEGRGRIVSTDSIEEEFNLDLEPLPRNESIWLSEGEWPLTINVKAESMVHEGDHASTLLAQAMVQVRSVIRDEIIFEKSFDLRNEQKVDEIYLFGLEPFEPVVEIALISICNSSAEDAAKASCLVETDPLIKFDQTKFDEIRGEDAYNWDKYFKLSYSPQVVPLPGALPLMLGGLVVVGGVLRGGRVRAQR